MALLRSLPENASLADLRRTYADLLEKSRRSTVFKVLLVTCSGSLPTWTWAAWT
jgi:hypothetical protein